MFELTAQGIAMGLTYYVVLLFSVSVHESAHAWAALRLGDDTAHREGRISLNPIVHIDPIGTLLIPLLQMFWGGIPLLGWAKPTPYNPGNFHRGVSLARGHMVVAGAGPVSNMILALLFTAALFLVRRTGIDLETHRAVFMLFVGGITMNVALAVFNLVPLPPLDGSKVASWGLPRSIADAYDRVMEPYGVWILLILFATGLLGTVVGPVIEVARRWLFSLTA